VTSTKLEPLTKILTMEETPEDPRSSRSPRDDQGFGGGSEAANALWSARRRGRVFSTLPPGAQSTQNFHFTSAYVTKLLKASSGAP